jgi:hypothetical protein
MKLLRKSDDFSGGAVGYDNMPLAALEDMQRHLAALAANTWKQPEFEIRNGQFVRVRPKSGL